MADHDRHRLLVTGSRAWNDVATISTVLGHYTRAAHALGGALEVVHGAASGGADHLAAAWVARWHSRGYPVVADPHPARWNGPCVTDGAVPCKVGHRHPRADGTDYCPRAGHRRNQQMVDTRPLVCVGFLRNGSSGTRDCLRRARQAGIPTLAINWSERHLVTPQWLDEHAPQLLTAQEGTP